MSATQHEEFRDYVAARGPALLRTAMLLTTDRTEAEDLLQAALAKTYLAWDRINDRAALDGYVRRAMINTQISWWRRRKLEVYPTDDLPDQPVDDHTLRSELHDLLGRALGRLPERQRAAVMLRYYEDMSETEVAQILGISVGTVKSTVSRAMAKLRADAELEHNFTGSPGSSSEPGSERPVSDEDPTSSSKPGSVTHSIPGSVTLPGAPSRAGSDSDSVPGATVVRIPDRLERPMS